MMNIDENLRSSFSALVLAVLGLVYVSALEKNAEKSISSFPRKESARIYHSQNLHQIPNQLPCSNPTQFPLNSH